MDDLDHVCAACGSSFECDSPRLIDPQCDLGDERETPCDDSDHETCSPACRARYVGEAA